MKNLTRKDKNMLQRIYNGLSFICSSFDDCDVCKAKEHIAKAMGVHNTIEHKENNRDESDSFADLEKADFVIKKQCALVRCRNVRIIMDRLTKRFGDKTILPNIPLPDSSTIKCSADLDKYHQNRRSIEAQIIRLSEYEDSGLSPEEVREMAEALKQAGDILQDMVDVAEKCGSAYLYRRDTGKVIDLLAKIAEVGE